VTNKKYNFSLNSNGTPNEMNEATTEYAYLGSMPLVALKRSMTTDPLNWIEVDHLNSPKSVVKLGKTKDGYSYYHNIVWRWETEPYGSYPPQETIKFDYGYGPNNIATTTTFTMNLRFPGQVYDKETGTHYNVFRDYDPQTGRYLQADPIGLGGGMNRWGYVYANPLKFTDALGLDGSGGIMIGNIPPYPKQKIPTDYSVCNYYDCQYKETGNSYYKEGAKICRGQNGLVNVLSALAEGPYPDRHLQDTLQKVREGLVAADKDAVRRGIVGPDGAVRGNEIDNYHWRVFKNNGLNPIFYGGNIFPQNTSIPGIIPIIGGLGNPVPHDPTSSFGGNSIFGR
jgi:RHS repeat-associated protein